MGMGEGVNGGVMQKRGQTPFFQYARGDARWNSDFDFWTNFPVDRSTLLEIEEALEESFASFNADLVTTAQLTGRFGEIVKQEARPWL